MVDVFSKIQQHNLFDTFTRESIKFLVYKANRKRCLERQTPGGWTEKSVPHFWPLTVTPRRFLFLYYLHVSGTKSWLYGSMAGGGGSEP